MSDKNKNSVIEIINDYFKTQKKSIWQNHGINSTSKKLIEDKEKADILLKKKNWGFCFD